MCPYVQVKLSSLAVCVRQKNSDLLDEQLRTVHTRVQYCSGDVAFRFVPRTRLYWPVHVWSGRPRTHAARTGRRGHRILVDHLYMLLHWLVDQALFRLPK